MFGRFDRLVDGVGTGVFVFLLALVSFSVDKKFHEWLSGFNGNSQQNSTMLRVIGQSFLLQATNTG